MSMWMDLVALSKEAFERVRADGSLLDALFFAEEDDGAAAASLGVTDADMAGCDYLSLAYAFEAANDAGDDDTVDASGEGDDEDDIDDDDDDDDDDAGDDEDEEEDTDADEDDEGPAEGEPDFEATGELDFDAGYGPAFFVAPGSAALDNDSWQLAASLDEEVGALLARAKAQGLYVVAVIS